MDEDAARSVLLIRAVEDSDVRGEVLAPADRRWATREAAPPQVGDAGSRRDSRLSPEEESFLLRRARLLLRGLESRFPPSVAAHEAVRWRGWAAVALAVGSFALGMAANELDASRHVNIVSFPLLGMLAWNAVVYVLLAARAMRGWSATGEEAARRGPWVRVACAGLVRASGAALREAAPKPLAAGLRDYTAQWTRLASPLYAARARRVLHLCAALLAAGAVAGLYLRGIALEYRAGWESTFLDAQAVHALVQLVLGPASAATGISLPDAAGIESLRWTGTGSGENAARWIHLYAATVVLFVILPRLALALRAGYAELRLRRDFPLPDDMPRYCRAILAARHVHERTASADVVACDYTLSDRALAILENELREKTGARISAKLRAAVRYGEEEDHVRALAGRERQAADYTVLVFNMSATPEEENQGLLLHAYLTAASPAAPLIVVLDEAAYRQRLAGQAGADARLDERRAAWKQFAQAHGVDLVPLHLDTPAADSAWACA